MVNSQRLHITLSGGAPWGFRLTGGGALPLTINKIRKKSAAHSSGLHEGDAVISINGVPVHDKSQDEALELVENAGDTLDLALLRGDSDELTRVKPKKPIHIAGSPVGGGFIITASVDDVSSSQNQVNADTSSNLVLTTSVDGMTSDSYQVDTGVGGGFTLTATVDDPYGSTFDVGGDNSTGFTLTTSIDDMTSSTNQMVQSYPTISADVGEFTATASAEIGDTETATINTNVLAEPFVNTRASLSPARLSPLPPRVSPKPWSPKGQTSSVSPKPFSPKPQAPSVSPKPFSPKPQTPSFSPKPFSPKLQAPSVSPKPFSPKQQAPSVSPKPFSPKAQTSSVSPKPFSPKTLTPNVSPKPFSSKPVTPNASPKPWTPKPQAPNVSPKPLSPNPVVSKRTPSPRAPPSSISPKPPKTTCTASTHTFDDGETRRQVSHQAQVTTSEDGKTTRRIEQETTTTTTSTKRVGPPFVKSQASAFNTVPRVSSNKATQHTNTAFSTSVSTNTLKSTPSSGYFKQQPQQPWQPPTPTISTSRSTSSINQSGLTPVFKPTRFVPGPSKKEIKGLFTPGSQKVDVTASAMYKTDGKENVAPAQSMFQVKNIVSEKSKSSGKDIWRPNIWLPDQPPSVSKKQQQRQKQQQKEAQQTAANDFSPYTTFPVPNLPPGISLMDRNKPMSSRASEMDDSYYNYLDDDDEEDGYHYRDGQDRLHVFGPPVEIHAHDDYDAYGADGEPAYMHDYHDGPLSPTGGMSKKKMYSDSAFYDTPGKNFPTITEQMKLCKSIAQSLTSAANRRARGAKMFMRRKRKSNKWVHESRSDWSSSAGDVANLRELDSELSPDDDRRALFYFKVPNLKQRVGGDAKQTKMALTQEQFEKLRLNAKKCDHRVVPPDTCFDIVADLKAHKGRGGRMFERQKQRSDKFVIVNDNSPVHMPQRKLEHILSQPVRQETTPWEAAMQHGGNVDSAFNHITEMERNQKLNQMLKFAPPRKLQTTPLPPGVQSAPLPPLGRTSLKGGGVALLQGTNFNRSAVGWHGGGEYPIAEAPIHVSPTRTRAPSLAPTSVSAPTANYGDYNNKVKAWQAPGGSPYVTTSQSQGDQWDNRPAENSPWAAPAYDMRQEQQTFQPSRPKSWQTEAPNSYDTHYKDEYEYNYFPVETSRFAASTESQPTVAYMQPIIPGTDL